MGKNMTFIYGNVQKCIFFCKKNFVVLCEKFGTEILCQKSRTIFVFFFCKFFAQDDGIVRCTKNDFKNWKICARNLAQKSCAKKVAQKFLWKKNAQKCTIFVPYIKIPT